MGQTSTPSLARRGLKSPGRPPDGLPDRSTARGAASSRTARHPPARNGCPRAAHAAQRSRGGGPALRPLRGVLVIRLASRHEPRGSLPGRRTAGKCLPPRRGHSGGSRSDTTAGASVGRPSDSRNARITGTCVIAPRGSVGGLHTPGSAAPPARRHDGAARPTSGARDGLRPGPAPRNPPWRGSVPRHDRRPQPRRRRQHAVVGHQVRPLRRHQCRQLTQERLRLEHQPVRAVRPRPAQVAGDAAIRATAEPGPDRGALVWQHGYARVLPGHPERESTPAESTAFSRCRTRVCRWVRDDASQRARASVPRIP